jgi:uncharacterized protein involved in outer membrane biogenesis
MKRIAIAAAILLAAGVAAVALLARSVLTGDNVRTAVAAQVSKAIGQPVTIARLGVSVYPRVTMDLTDVAIGEPAGVQLASVHVETGLWPLISRRIERAVVRVDGARITLPLPYFGGGWLESPGPEVQAEAPVQIVSIDEIVLSNAEVVSGGRTLAGDIELIPEAAGARIRRIALSADGTTIEMTGVLTSLSPVEGQIDARSEAADLDRLMAFLADFSRSAPVPAGSPSDVPDAAQPATGVHGRLIVTLTVGRATTGGLALSDLEATATVTPAAVTFDPIQFGVFGGRYDGTMHLALDGSPRFSWRADVSGIDAAALMEFAGAPDTITGALTGAIALDGAGLEMDRALRTARGTARLDITDGTIAGLALVRTIVTASSGRGGILASASSALASPADAAASERFSRLGATLTIADGRMTTTDLTLQSTDVDLTAAGTLSVATLAGEFAGRAQLSEALSAEAGTDLRRYAQEGGRVTLPVTLTGPIGHLAVRVDVGDAAMRAIRNRALEEAQKALERNIPRGLRGIIRKPPGG